MINGVLQIIAAVLFAVVHLSTDMGIIWLCIACVYLVVGIANLIIYVIKNQHQLHMARKQSKKIAEEAEKTALMSKGKAVQNVQQAENSETQKT